MRKQKPEISKKTRLTMDLTPQQLARMERLEKKTDNTKAGIMREAIRMYEYILDRTTEGYTFKAFDADGVAEKIFFLME